MPFALNNEGRVGCLPAPVKVDIGKRGELTADGVRNEKAEFSVAGKRGVVAMSAFDNEGA